jgi:hypothetical protein
MQTTTQSFFDNSIYKFRKTKYELSFDIYDVTSKQDCTTTSNKRRIEHLNELIDDVNKPNDYFVDGEVGGFPLNGTKKTMQDSLENILIGWWSPISNENGIWDSHPILNFNFTEAHTSIGITLNFDEYSTPKRIKTTWFDETNSIISSQYDEVNSAEFFVDNGVENYFKIIVEFIETYPHRYIKLYEIWFGKKYIFTGDELMSAKCKEQISLISNQIYPNELSFTLDNTNGQYDLFNPTKLMKYFQKRQMIQADAFISADSDVLRYEGVPMGTYYLDTFESKQGKAQFKAYGLLNLMNSQPFYKSKYYVNEKVSTIINDIIPEYKYYIHSNVRDIELTGYIPYVSKKDALKKISIATGSIVRESRDGVIYIYRPTKDVIENNIITENTIYEQFGFSGLQLSGLSIMPPLIKPLPLIFSADRNTRLGSLESTQIPYYDRCDIECISYTNSVDVDPTELFSGIVMTNENGLAVVQYTTDSPAYKQTVEVTKTELTFDHYACATVVKGLPHTEYQLIVKGFVMVKNKTIITSSLGINSPGEIAQTIPLTKDNELVGNVSTAKYLSNWYLNQMQKRNDIKFKWWSICTTEAGDFLYVYTDYGKKLESQISSIEYDLQGLTATVKGVV